MSLVRLEDPAAARAWCAAERAAGRALGLVPTMGALHEGHLSLVRRAVAENDLAVASVFVNPLQFDDPGDLAAYPRDFESDAALLAEAGCAMVFTGTLEGFFPEAQGGEVPLLAPGPAAQGLEGACRAGHFEGVVTIVARLFEVVGPARAYFGEKDFQQLLVIRDLVRRQGGPEVVACAISRDPDGLARSSRNVRLGPDERARALVLSRSLGAAEAAWRDGVREAEALAAVMRAELACADVAVEYAEVRDPERWSPGPPRGPLTRARALVAARVGDVRLIDNAALGA